MASTPRVVLVDDLLEDRKAAVRVLSSIATVVLVTDALALDAAMALAPVDVLVTEQSTSWIQGFDAADRVRAKWPNCACVMLTTTGSESVVIAAKSRGFTDYLLKTRRGYDALAAAVSAAAAGVAKAKYRKESPEATTADLASPVASPTPRPDPAARTFSAPERMASGAVHEFNNMLTVILGSSSILLERLPEGDPCREDALAIHSTALRASELTREWITVCQETPDIDQVAAPSASSHVISKGTVLLVDDEPAVRRFVHRTLESAGYHVIVADNAAHALELCGGDEPCADLLVTDLVMPDTDGAALATALRAKHPRLRVLLMSGYSETSGQKISARIEGAMFLPKPFTPTSLVSKVAEVLR